MHLVGQHVRMRLCIVQVAVYGIEEIRLMLVLVAIVLVVLLDVEDGHSSKLHFLHHFHLA